MFYAKLPYIDFKFATTEKPYHPHHYLACIMVCTTAGLTLEQEILVFGQQKFSDKRTVLIFLVNHGLTAECSTPKSQMRLNL